MATPTPTNNLQNLKFAEVGCGHTTLVHYYGQAQYYFCNCMFKIEMLKTSEQTLVTEQDGLSLMLN